MKSLPSFTKRKYYFRIHPLSKKCLTEQVLGQKKNNLQINVYCAELILRRRSCSMSIGESSEEMEITVH